MLAGRHQRTARLRAAVAANRQRPYVAAPSILMVPGRAGKVVLNSGETVPIQYVVVEARWLVTSHCGARYERDPRYPAEAQPRDYSAEAELQMAVEERAAMLDPWRLLTDSVLAVDGPPIVRSDGVVISGNGRTQSIRLAIDRGIYGDVRDGITERAAAFHLNPALLCKLKQPVLVRLMRETVTDSVDLARYGLEMNRDPGQGMSTSEQSMGLSRLMTPAVVERLASLIAEAGEGCSAREFMRLHPARIAAILSDCGLVDPRKRAEHFTADGNLTEAAKDLVETTLAGLTVTDIAVIRGASRATRDRLVRVGIEFMRMRSAGAEWCLAQYNNEAVALVTRAEDQATYLRTLAPAGQFYGGALVARLLHAEQLAGANASMGFAHRTPVHPAVEALALALDLPQREYVATVGEYARRAAGAWRSMFECLQPADTFTETIGTRRGPDGTTLWCVPVGASQWPTNSISRNDNRG